MDEFETEVRAAFRAPMTRVPGRDVAQAAVRRLDLYDRLRVGAVVGGTFTGVAIMAGALSATHSAEAAPELMRLANEAFKAVAMHPTVLVAVGGAFFLAAMARVAARDL